MMVSQNEVSLENFEVEECDQMRSPKINVVRSRVPSQDAMSFKSKKGKLSDDDKHDNEISLSFDNISMAIVDTSICTGRYSWSPTSSLDSNEKRNKCVDRLCNRRVFSLIFTQNSRVLDRCLKE